jgi:hypothetical protein
MVGEHGDLFYLQPQSPIEIVCAPSAPRHKYNGSIVNPINGSQGSSSDGSNTKGLKDKVKGIIGRRNDNKSNLTNSQLNKHNLTSGHGVTFNDVPTGVMKEVVIFVDPFKHNYGRRASKVENLFGIIPGHFGSPSHDSDGSGMGKDKRIMVQGLVPNAEAMNSGVKIGK